MGARRLSIWGVRGRICFIRRRILGIIDEVVLDALGLEAAKKELGTVSPSYTSGLQGVDEAEKCKGIAGCRLSKPWMAISILCPARAEEDRTLLGLKGRRVSRCERSLALAQTPSYTGSCKAGY